MKRAVAAFAFATVFCTTTVAQPRSSTQSAPAKTGIDQKGDAPELKLLSLNYARASHVADAVKFLFKEGEVRAHEMPEDNLVLLYGKPADLLKVQALAAKLDQAPPAKPETKEQHLVYKLRNLSSAPTAEMILKLMGNKAGDELKVASDGGSTLIISASESKLKSVVQLIEDLDSTADRSARENKNTVQSRELELRFLWIRSERQKVAERPQAAATDLEELFAILEQQGVQSPVVNCEARLRTTVQWTEDSLRLSPQIVRPGGTQQAIQFTMQSSNLFKGRLTAGGRIWARSPDKFAMNLDIRVLRSDDLNAPQNQSGYPHCSISTEITTPLDDLVVLGTAPVDGAPSVFVVQIRDANTLGRVKAKPNGSK